MSAIDYLGWSATFVFVASYFCGRASALRRTQMAGAMMWILYGSLLRAYPVVVANVLVFAAAAWTQIVSNREPSFDLAQDGPEALEGPRTALRPSSGRS